MNLEEGQTYYITTADKKTVSAIYDCAIQSEAERANNIPIDINKCYHALKISEGAFKGITAYRKLSEIKTTR